jgi:glycosyltransferase involved in cell wall biosynthesis
MEDNNSLISVIIPVYKVEKYLDKCLKSVVGQTYTNLEIIIVDDGSPDRCGEICDEWAHKDKRIKVIHKTNGGLSDARNAGLDIAKGGYIGFVDSDDYIHPEMYLMLYHKLLQVNADIVVCGIEMVDELGNTLSGQGFSPSIADGFTINDLKQPISRCIRSNVWNKLYKRDLWAEIRFPRGKIFEDTFVIHRILAKSQCTASIKDRLYYYVQSPHSIIRRTKGIDTFDRIEAFYDRTIFLEEMALQSLIPNEVYEMFYRYLVLSGEVHIRTKTERKRVYEVRRMVRYCYRRYGNKIRKIDIILFEMPHILRFFRWIKRTFSL